MIYIDTSLIIAALTREAMSWQVQQWLSNQENGTLAISDWVATEVASALSMKVRTGDLTAARRADTQRMWRKLQAESFHRLPILSAYFYIAARFADQDQLGLRAGDALHVAICAEQGLELATLDQKMAYAAIQLGVPVKAI